MAKNLNLDKSTSGDDPEKNIFFMIYPVIHIGFFFIIINSFKNLYQIGQKQHETLKQPKIIRNPNGS